LVFLTKLPQLQKEKKGESGLITNNKPQIEENSVQGLITMLDFE